MLADPDDGQTATGKPPAINGFEALPDGKPLFPTPGVRTSLAMRRCARGSAPSPVTDPLATTGL